MTFGNKALKKNNKLEQTINEITQQNKLIIDQLKDNQNNLHLKLFDYQCQIWEDESQTIEGDPQYQEEIRNLNNLRDQTIEQMKQVIRNVQQLQNQQQNQQNQNFQQGQIQDDGDFQNILNQIKQANQLIQETENQLEYFRKTIQFYIDQNINDNDQKQKVKISIMSGLKQISFTVVRQVFERVVQSLKEFKISNERLNQNNQVLQEKLTEQQRENNQSNEQFKGLVDKLQSQLNQEIKRHKNQLEIEGYKLLIMITNIIIYQKHQVDYKKDFLGDQDQIFINQLIIAQHCLQVKILIYKEIQNQYQRLRVQSQILGIRVQVMILIV
ncbi:unnamed protein product [Paramecium sonneborni]|uniref:Uncharacterized protein n=1 Tax=Paramecium sonneborni TaxID=65129 RepID=A0A8S1R5P3_9CILI|nr:unnamed protein product [Paramecium sonneborni]